MRRTDQTGGVLTFPSFHADFAIADDPDTKTRVSAIAVGIQQAFALLGSLAIWPLTNRHGRRPAMILCSAVFCAGVVLETLRSGSIATFYAGRVVCGLGIGGSATIIPIYLGEMSPTDMRARLGSCYQFTFTLGILVSYWVDYAVVRINPTTAGTGYTGSGESWRWQIPIALQIVPGALMGLGALTLHESVRWLLFHADANPAVEQRAWQSLIWIRGADTTVAALKPVQAEFTSIKRTIQSEHHARAGFHPTELITHKPNLHRLLLGFTIFLAQQSTGATALAYFGPQFFGMLVGSLMKTVNDNNASGSSVRDNGNDTTLLLTGIFGAVKVLACLVFVVFVAERFGRRFLLITGALVMAVCMVITGVVVKIYPPPAPITPSSSDSEAAGSSISHPAGLITVLLIYLNITAFNLSWGPLPWPCIAEIFPTRMREPGVAFGVASQWLFNFVWSASTPYIMAGCGWATFVLFGALDLGIAGFVWGFLQETKGLSLEEIEGLFERCPNERPQEDEERARLQPKDSPRYSPEER